MTRTIAATLVLGFAISGAGCTIEERVSTRERPPDRVEVVPVAPSARHVWVRGHWDRDGDGWIWIRGRWELR